MKTFFKKAKELPFGSWLKCLLAMKGLRGAGCDEIRLPSLHLECRKLSTKGWVVGANLGSPLALHTPTKATVPSAKGSPHDVDPAAQSHYQLYAEEIFQTSGRRPEAA